MWITSSQCLPDLMMNRTTNHFATNITVRKQGGHRIRGGGQGVGRLSAHCYVVILSLNCCSRPEHAKH
jgi:hypothetical protein